ncbi:MAG: glycerol-3-phosphate 1-O-acyltransferase PlsY [Halofilum sp. (in: g-proteobacteria)]|nr:glycerol-3-phosphate 1-O-acyltransferase PlsY [Halofilum sp. (in: g-proteobacteria)]
MTSAVLDIAVVGSGYLLGSISTAILVCRLLGRTDPRTTGSRNPGATNVLRVAGRDAAIMTLAGDLLKGVVAVLAARALGTEPVVWLLAGAAAFLGHLYPVFFGFRGGKGVATAFGMLLAALPIAGLMAVATWVAAFAVARISSIGALTAFALAPVYVAWTSRSIATTAIMAAVSLLLFWRHRSNIRRLVERSET